MSTLSSYCGKHASINPLNATDAYVHLLPMNKEMSGTERVKKKSLSHLTCIAGCGDTSLHRRVTMLYSIRL